MYRMIHLCIALIMLLIHLPKQRVMADDPVDFTRDVLPILETYCIGCHTADDAQGGLVMETHEALMNGGEKGAVVTPGVADSSRMLLMATGKLEPVMPPDDMQGPNDDELAVLARWIDGGAPGPGGSEPIRRSLRVPSIATSVDAHSPITAIAISPSAMLRATARFQTITLDSLNEQGQPIVGHQREISGMPGKINSLQFSQDGSKLLVASGLTGAYGQATLMNLNDPKSTPIQFVGHRDILYAAEFSPDESVIATAGYDREIVLWDAASGKSLRKLTGHNGAIFDLAFSPDGKVLASACDDETAKIWRVSDGERLDTLSQSEGSVMAVEFTRDGKFVLTAGADNRLRAYRLRSIDQVVTNPLIATRYLAATPVIRLAVLPDDSAVVAMTEDGSLKLVTKGDWNPVIQLQSLESSGSDLAIAPDGCSVWVTLMNGDLAVRPIPPSPWSQSQSISQPLDPIHLDLETLINMAEPVDAPEVPGAAEVDEQPTIVPRGVSFSGRIDKPGDCDVVQWQCAQGEVWAIDGDAIPGSMLDPFVTILDHSGTIVTRVRLQAVRDSYFTFRGKDSMQSNDFRLFAWEEMRLNDYLYAAGEVTRLSLYPRGPDSGFDVYPGQATRHTYFGTSHVTHALGEPAFVVRPLANGEASAANGLPVFDIPYQNDDDPQRVAGKNSRLIFTAPSDGLYQVRMEDSRGEGGENYGYTLSIRAASPSFRVSTQPITKPIRRGTGREFTVTAVRIDDYEGPIEISTAELPPGVITNLPLVIEAGQSRAIGVVWSDSSSEQWQPKVNPRLVARATILGRRVERDAGTMGELKIEDRPEAIPIIDAEKLIVRRGETITARVVLDRKPTFNNEVPMGKEYSARNAPFGVYVDNIGLNGLLVLSGTDQREFFLTADAAATLGKRFIHLTAEIDGNVTTRPVELEVVE